MLLVVCRVGSRGNGGDGGDGDALSGHGVPLTWPSSNGYDFAMARPRLPKDVAPLRLLVPRSQARAQITNQLASADALRPVISAGPVLNDTVNSVEMWSRYNIELLARIVDRQDWVYEYQNAHVSQAPLAGEERDPRRLLKKLDDHIGALKRFNTVLDLLPEPAVTGVMARTAVKYGLLEVPATDSRTVFVVHGHDHDARDAVELFLRRVGLNPIILAERASRSNTVIEKIEREGVCDFAVVLLTPDDKGGPKDIEPKAYRYRARQNVLLELGFFIGKLGREKVCAIHKGDVEIPSDYSGVLWVRFDDAGIWKRELGKELVAAGLPADLSKS